MQDINNLILFTFGSKECILCLDSFKSPWDQPGPSQRTVEILLADMNMLPSVIILITMFGGERSKETTWTTFVLCPLTNLHETLGSAPGRVLQGWAEKLIVAVDCLPLSVTILGNLGNVSTAETLWEHWQKENIKKAN